MEVRRIDGDRIEDALAVRRAVFVDEQGVPEDREIDGKDGEAIHFVAYDEDEPIGVARLRAYGERGAGTAKIERVAVLADRRGEGLGRELMCRVEETARDEGYTEVVLHAQLPVVSFYAGLGYDPVGESFEDAGIEHREMWKEL